MRLFPSFFIFYFQAKLLVGEAQDSFKYKQRNKVMQRGK